MRYSVTVDYVTSADVIVEAADEGRAVDAAGEFMRTQGGAAKLLRLMRRNVPDGFDIALVERAGEHCGPPLIMAEKPKLVHEYVDMWENHDDEERCPFCGEPRDYERREEDDGFDWDGHWIAFRFECNNCGGGWWASYRLGGAKLEAVE